MVQSCVDTYRARYRAQAAALTPVMDGIRELLATLAGRMPLVVATSKPQALAEPLLDALHLRESFAAVVGPSLEAEHEPKTVTVGRALERVSGARDVVMVGDRRYDIEAAQARGLRSVGVLWGIGTRAELEAAGADELVADTDELREQLAGGADLLRAQGRPSKLRSARHSPPSLRENL